ncbi:50S ribosomal protein L11 methyltransferase [Candidatus Nitrosacidococcus tergens]|uniref:Ribosomal protein L11 methyltransferase n=1 Tax=Candidatus Nitrosacidococcus tergens TaxID=553981 RepID=A0A7G1QC70_9GAMM|nr:50S ribosomal protein L11 methyltransferase [Candidatus Nitrosacidococcus tergens]CAB1277198.1 methylase for 50S ribosomal subunit protein L11 [Candidatus Nitrosacidococcus tergens]
MPWLEIQFREDSHKAQQLADALSEVGAVAVTLTDAIEQPIFEPPLGDIPLWALTYINALFPIGTDLNLVLTHLKQIISFPLPVYQSKILEDQNWDQVWRENFKPLRFGQQLWVCPSWLPIPEPEAINIILDPGLAFGTGSHPTTALCLEWLASTDINQKNIIDYGCGSGILAIAALKLGVTTAIGIDHDPQALLAAQENATRNGADTHLQVLLPSESITIKTDFLIANILLAPLVELAPKFAQLIVPKGTLILSGILQSQIKSIVQTYNTWFSFDPPSLKEDWALLVGHRL